jgi:hypothetical protein
MYDKSLNLPCMDDLYHVYALVCIVNVVAFFVPGYLWPIGSRIYNVWLSLNMAIVIAHVIWIYQVGSKLSFDEQHLYHVHHLVACRALPRYTVGRRSRCSCRDPNMRVRRQDVDRPYGLLCISRLPRGRCPVRFVHTRFIPDKQQTDTQGTRTRRRGSCWCDCRWIAPVLGIPTANRHVAATVCKLRTCKRVLPNDTRNRCILFRLPSLCHNTYMHRSHTGYSVPTLL